MNEVFSAADRLQGVCKANGWDFCFIGGVALQRWGAPRTTVDVDLTLLTGFGDEARFADTLLEHFESRLPHAAAFAVENRILLLRSAEGVGLDIALGALPFEEEAVRRSSYFDFPAGVSLRLCSAEDLIVMKAFAGRGQDWVDVRRIVQRQGEKLDWGYIDLQLAPLAEFKGDAGLMATLHSFRSA